MYPTVNKVEGECRGCRKKAHCMESDRGIRCMDYDSIQEYLDRCRKAKEDIEKLNNKRRGQHEESKAANGGRSNCTNDSRQAEDDFNIPEDFMKVPDGIDEELPFH